MTTNRGRTAAPLAACGVILAALAVVGLARGYDGAEPDTGRESPGAAPVDAGPPPDGGLSSEQIRRLLEDEPMDVNRATAEELELLPRIGPTLARRIVRERQQGGPFAEPTDLTSVRGIGPRTLEGLADLVTVEPIDSPAGSPASSPDGGAL